MADPIKVLIVEDSPTIAQILKKLMESDPQLQVVGVATDGAEAIRLVARFRPNVITMDVQMPRMTGLEATEYIMAHYPTPILVLTASLGRQDVDLSFKMLSTGALEIIEKPSGSDWGKAGEKLLERIKLVSRVKVITHIRGKTRFPKVTPELETDKNTISPSTTKPNITTPLTITPPKPDRPISNIPRNRADGVTAPLDPSKVFKPSPTSPTAFNEIAELRKRKFQLVGIAASTGGPPALANVLRQIPANFPIPILVVQHIPPGFSSGLADWLNGETALHVKLASEGEKAVPGFAYLPADDRHLQIGSDFRLHLSEQPARYGLRPSADITFESMAKAFPGETMAFILTGMGRDGSQGMKAMYDAGGYNVAQDEATSVIFGMPKSAIELGVVNKVLPLPEMPSLLKQVFLD